MYLLHMNDVNSNKKLNVKKKRNKEKKNKQNNKNKNSLNDCIFHVQWTYNIKLTKTDIAVKTVKNFIFLTFFLPLLICYCCWFCTQRFKNVKKKNNHDSYNKQCVWVLAVTLLSTVCYLMPVYLQFIHSF